MVSSLDKPRLDNLADEIWKSAERLRGKFKTYEYQSVTLPIIVKLDRFDELADVKYTDIGGIFDIMAVTVIQSQLLEM